MDHRGKANLINQGTYLKGYLNNICVYLFVYLRTSNTQIKYSAISFYICSHNHARILNFNTFSHTHVANLYKLVVIPIQDDSSSASRFRCKLVLNVYSSNVVRCIGWNNITQLVGKHALGPHNHVEKA